MSIKNIIDGTIKISNDMKCTISISRATVRSGTTTTNIMCTLCEIGDFLVLYIPTFQVTMNAIDIIIINVEDLPPVTTNNCYCWINNGDVNKMGTLSVLENNTIQLSNKKSNNQPFENEKNVQLLYNVYFVLIKK
jgi:hypothetical protein